MAVSHLPQVPATMTKWLLRAGSANAMKMTLMPEVLQCTILPTETRISIPICTEIPTAMAPQDAHPLGRSHRKSCYHGSSSTDHCLPIRGEGLRNHKAWVISLMRHLLLTVYVYRDQRHGWYRRGLVRSLDDNVLHRRYFELDNTQDNRWLGHRTISTTPLPAYLPPGPSLVTTCSLNLSG